MGKRGIDLQEEINMHRRGQGVEGGRGSKMEAILKMPKFIIKRKREETGGKEEKT